MSRSTEPDGQPDPPGLEPPKMPVTKKYVQPTLTFTRQPGKLDLLLNGRRAGAGKTSSQSSKDRASNPAAGRGSSGDRSSVADKVIDSLDLTKEQDAGTDEAPGGVKTLKDDALQAALLLASKVTGVTKATERRANFDTGDMKSKIIRFAYELQAMEKEKNICANSEYNYNFSRTVDVLHSLNSQYFGTVTRRYLQRWHQSYNLETRKVESEARGVKVDKEFENELLANLIVASIQDPDPNRQCHRGHCGPEILLIDNNKRQIPQMSAIGGRYNVYSVLGNDVLKTGRMIGGTWDTHLPVACVCHDAKQDYQHTESALLSLRCSFL
jgi:hypothetical protein